jgi:hypothetical protein
MNHMLFVGLLGVSAVALCWSLAVVLFRVGPAGGVARRLAVLLGVEGVTLISAGFPEFVLGLSEDFFFEQPGLVIPLDLAHFLGDAGMVALYPPFLAAALGTALTRPFGKTAVRIPIAVVAVAMAIAATVANAVWNSSAVASILYVMVTLMFLFALAASLNAWNTATPGVARTRAGLFAAAFGIRDVCWCFAYAASFWTLLADMGYEFAIFWWYKAIYALGTLLAVPLIAYGILRAHLFDIDLRIRWTIKQSTLAALVVAIIFLISEGASTFLSAELGPVAGLFAAAVVMFFLTPLQHFAERVAAAAMPKTENTPEYVAFRKMQVYEAALIDAAAEGGISSKERALLAHLRESLGIRAADAEAIERELETRTADRVSRLASSIPPGENQTN